MSKTNWEIFDPVSKTKRIVVIEITQSGASFDFMARFSDESIAVIASGKNAAPSESETLALAKKLVTDQRTI